MARAKKLSRAAEVVLPPDPPVAREPGESVVVRLDSGYTIGRVVSQEGYRITVSVCGVERDFDDCEVVAHCAETGALCHPGGARVA